MTGRAKSGNYPDESDLQDLKEEFSSVLTDELPTVLQPKREVNHKMEVKPGLIPRHRCIFQLSTAELLSTKDYIKDFRRKQKI